MGHSEYGPSSAERWINCPGSVQLGRGLPALPTSKYAAEGTVAHKLAEQLCLEKLTDMDLMGKVGDVVEEDGIDVTITEEMVQHVAGYAAAVQRDVRALRIANRPAGVFSHVELKVHLRLEGEDNEIVYGTADNVIYQKGNLLIVRDLKYGKGKPVSPVENLQEGIYALAVQDTVAGEAFDDVELVIDQPRTNGETRWKAPKEWLRELRYRVAAAVKATREPNAPLKAGSWCRWCKAQSVCPEVQAAQQREAEIDFKHAPPLPAAEGKLVVNQAMVDAATPERLGQILRWEEPLKSFYGAVKARAQQLLERGETVPGWKLVNGRANRKWGDGVEGAVTETMTGLGFPNKVYAPREMLSPAKMESAVGKKVFAEKLARFVIKPEGRKSIAEAGDERPETAPSAVEDFGAGAPALPGPTTQPAPAEEDPFFAPTTAPVPKKIWP